jgi:hypothetical protein
VFKVLLLFAALFLASEYLHITGHMFITAALKTLVLGGGAMVCIYVFNLSDDIKSMVQKALAKVRR